MSQINKYEITTLYGKHEQKHIVNALTAQDAITQFKVKMDNVKPCNIINIEPYQQVFTGEQIIRMNQLREQVGQRIAEQESKTTPKNIIKFFRFFLK
jgi:hypothetical protein